METKKFCKLRQDLINKELGAPIGDSFYNSTQPIEYRWLEEIDFQVFFDGKWENAESVDFDFADPINLIEQAKAILLNAGYFGITWTLSDIVERAKSDGYLINETQAREIAKEIENHHDCEIGINWDNISFHIGEFAEKNSLPELEFQEFEGENYPTRLVEIRENESVNIGVISLSKLLINEGGFPFDMECQRIDDTIFFYVEDNQINLPESELVELIKESL